MHEVPFRKESKVTENPVESLGPVRAKVRRIDVPAGQDPDHVARHAAQGLSEPGVMQSRRATLLPVVSTAELSESESAPEETAVHTQTSPSGKDWLSDFSEEERVSLAQLGSPRDVAKAYIHARRKMTQATQERAGLERQVADLVETQLAERSGPSGAAARTGSPREFLQSVEPPPDVKAMQEEISKHFLDDVGGSVGKIFEVAVKTARAEAQRAIEPIMQQQALREVQSMVETQFPGLVTAETAKDIDALASGAPGETAALRYRHALTRYAKLVGYEGPESNGERSRTTSVSEPISGPAPTAHSKPAKKPIYTRQRLDHLLLHDPDQYRRLQPEIMAAYAEGRVK